MFLIILILFKVQDRPLKSWTYRITPNSLISILTTAGKSSMMVVIASCVSQLKWHYFRRPHTLNRLQLLDDASRGPWGGLRVLTSGQFSISLPIAFAIITVLALGIEPSAQQILRTSPSAIELNLSLNERPVMARAESYDSRVWSTLHLDDYFEYIDQQHERPKKRIANYTDLLAYRIFMTSGVSQPTLQPYFQCPSSAKSCSWEEFTTLSICSSLEDVTASSTHECNSTENPKYMNASNSILTCTYTFPQWQEGAGTLSYPLSLEFESLWRYTIYRSALADPPTGSGAEFIKSIAILQSESNLNETRFDFKSPPKVKIQFGTWFWCTKTYQGATFHQGQALTLGVPKTERLIHSKIQERSTTIWKSNTTGQHYGTNFGPDDFKELFNDIDTVAKSCWDTWNEYYVWSWDGQYVKPEAAPPTWSDNVAEGGLYHPSSNYKRDPNSIASFVANSDPATIMQNVATALSNKIHSSDNRNMTLLRGKAFGMEVYWRVRWAWLILPLVEVVVTCALLVGTVFVTGGIPLFKGSLIALLVHGLEGWGEGEVEVSLPETSESLERLAEGMVVEFVEGGEGILKFVRS